MKLALIGTNIVPKSQLRYAKQYNLALYYIAAYLKTRIKDIDVEIVDIPIYAGMTKIPSRYIDKVMSIDTNIFGFSSYCWDRELTLNIIRLLKKERNDTKVILGGPTATFEGLHILSKNKFIDFAVVGEGEIVLERMIKTKFKDKNIKGLAIRNKDDVIFNGYSKSIYPLDIIPSPYIAGMIKPDEMNLMLGFSRGCGNKCKHCAWKSLGGGIRYFSKKRIVEELLWAKENKYRHIFIYDSSINNSCERMREITDSINECNFNTTLSFTYFVDHTNWDSTKSSLIKRINTRCAFIGLESISDGSTLSLGRRRVDIRKFDKFVKDITDAVPIIISVMLGIPTESGRDFKNTIDYVVRLVEKYGREKILGVRIFWTIITPGSRLDVERNKYNIKTTSIGIPYILSSDYYTHHDMVESFQYLNQHKYKELFIWEDINPKELFREVDDFNLLPECREKYKKETIDLKKILPNCVVGKRYYNRWILDSIYYDRIHPVLKFKNNNISFEVKIQSKQNCNIPYSTRRYSITIVGKLNPVLDRDAKIICGKIIEEIAQNE